MGLFCIYRRQHNKNNNFRGLDSNFSPLVVSNMSDLGKPVSLFSLSLLICKISTTVIISENQDRASEWKSMRKSFYDYYKLILLFYNL